MKAYKKALFLTFLFFAIINLTNCITTISQQVTKNKKYRLPKIAFILPGNDGNSSKEELNDLSSLKNSLLVAGLGFEEVSSSKIPSQHFDHYDILVIPYISAKKLNSADINLITTSVKSGVNLIFDGKSGLTEALGIKHSKDTLTVTQVKDLKYAKQKLYWNSPCQLLPILSTNPDYSVLCQDDTTKLPISVAGTFGMGKVIYFGTLFDPITNKGYTRFPFLIESLYDLFGFAPLAERQAAEMYFDPGNRSGDTLSMDELAKFWRKNKVKRIFAGGWYYDTDYDYNELITACHKNGIQVLCWLETPMISINFWNKHPEWREKTVFQRDAQIDWRYLMNLADTNCRKQVFKELDTFLVKHDWDGLDFAELYFEPSPVGPALPQNFTPMNQIVRNDYKKASGFDPVLLFDSASSHYWKKNNADWKKFALYRKTLLFNLKKSFLDFFTSVKHKKNDFEVMLTVLDVSITPELSDYIGEDTQNTLKLYNMCDITLQVEDPSNCWGLTPQRYDKMGKLYRQYVKGKDKLLFDCNVVSAHEQGFGGFPSEVPTGEEIRQIAYNMELHDVRPAFYSEDVVSNRDYLNISNTLANKASINCISDSEWMINTPKMITINSDSSNKEIYMDGKTWRASDGKNIIIPVGKHKLSYKLVPSNDNNLWIKNISGQLKSATFTNNTTTIEYEEAVGPCYLIINKKPGKVYVDNKLTNCQVLTNESDEYSLKLPQGEHLVKVETNQE
jgi:Alpha-galactosidase